LRTEPPSADNALQGVRAAIGHLEAQVRSGTAPEDLRGAEFQVFSQWNEDGIIQHLLRHVPIEDPSFIEFGVEDYGEANTKFLLINDNWRGLIMDADRASLDRVTASEGFMRRYDLHVHAETITRANLNEIVERHGFGGDIGLLSIDVDGNDYWLWEALSAASPRIVVIEYNSTLGPHEAITIPYDPDFDVWTAHQSWLYYGASLAALCVLARRKAYTFVGCESHGCNAFFVRDDVAGRLPALTAHEGYVPSRFRYARDAEGWIHVSDHRERLALMADARYEDVATGTVRTVAEIYGVL